METPCVNICTIDPQSRLCVGCLRSIDEIARWSAMTSSERRRIMDALPQRRALCAGSEPSRTANGRS
jgi:predicted Fe-S protein YdhL (DUF1289 family)